MSIGNTNFITLDSIAEIQDIVDGDYVFTVSNGVIYKLDFQNFIIPLQNVDFASTIESMSAQLVSLTNAFSAVNTTVNALSGLTAIPALSANWTSTWQTVNTLSASNWLPDIGTVSPGSVVYYSGGNASWKATKSGSEGNVLTVTNAIPTFAGSSTFAGIDTQSITYRHANLPDISQSIITDYPIIETMSFTTEQEYKELQINWSVAWEGGDILNMADPGAYGGGRKYFSTIKNLSRLYVKYGAAAGVPDEVYAHGAVVLKRGTNGPDPVTFYVIPQLEVTLTDDEWSKGYKIGEATSLGDSGSAETRWQVNDPAIIESVGTGVIPGGLPSTNSNIPYIWNFARVLINRAGQKGPVYNRCIVTLTVQGY